MFVAIAAIDEKIRLVAYLHVKAFGQHFEPIIIRFAEILREVAEINADFFLWGWHVSAWKFHPFFLGNQVNCLVFRADQKLPAGCGEIQRDWIYGQKTKRRLSTELAHR